MRNDDSSQRLFKDILNAPESPASPDQSGSSCPPYVDGRVVLARLGNGVRVTGQDAADKLLWGMVASKGMMEQPHCAVAIYSRLREIVSDTLAAEGLPSLPPADAVAAAKQSLQELRDLADVLLKKLTVKRESDSTTNRAVTIHRAVSDAVLMIRQETSLITQGREPSALE